MSIAAADFNGDGLVDIARVSDSSGYLQVLMGASHGGFGDEIELFIDWNVYSISAVDLDNDFDIDLVIGHYDLSVLLNNGDGSFATPSTYLGDRVYSVACADCDNDGDQDIVTGGTDSVMVYFNNGNGTLRKTPLTIGKLPAIIKSTKQAGNDRSLIADEFDCCEHMPVKVYEEQLSYPEEAKDADVEGIVWVRSLVDTLGRVREVTILKSSCTDVGFEETALHTAYKHRYLPAINRERRTSVWVAERVVFELK